MLDSAVGENVRLLQAAEPDEGRLLLELDNSFWSEDPSEIYKAAAQIVFTMGNLEEGRSITLIDGLRPGRIERPGGERIEQPLTREDFVQPLVQVVQPVAGATLARTIPIDLNLSPHQPVAVSMEVDDETLASTIVHGGKGELIVNNPPAGDAEVEIELDDQLTIEVPVRVSPRS